MFLISFGSVSMAGVGDVYFCQTSHVVVVTHSKNKPERYKNFNFKFKITDSHLIFGNEDNPFKNMKLEIVDKVFNRERGLEDSSDLIVAGDKWSILTYENGIFNYTMTVFEDTDSFTASCTKF